MAAMYDIGNKPAQARLTITAGDDWSRTVGVTGVDLTGATLRGQIRRTVGGATVAAITCSITDSDSFTASFTAPSDGGCSDSDPASKYVGEIEFVDTLGRVSTWLRLDIRVISEVASAT